MRLAVVLLALLAGPLAGAQEIPTVPPLPRGVEVRATTTLYDVTGATPGAIWDSVLERTPIRDEQGRPMGFSAFTRVRIDWTYRYAPSAGRCAATEVGVTAAIETILPRWTPPPRASTALRARWNRFIRRVQVHEEGHAARATVSAVRVHEAIRALRPRSCATFAAEADAAGQAVLDALGAWDRAYDRDTEHGRRQGAYWSTD